MSIFQRWFSSKDDSSQVRNHPSAGKEFIRQKRKMDPEELMGCVNLYGRESSRVRTLLGDAHVYYDKTGSRLRYIEVDAPVPTGTTFIPLIDPSQKNTIEVIGGYRIQEKPIRSLSGKKNIYIIEEQVELQDLVPEEVTQIRKLKDSIKPAQ